MKIAIPVDEKSLKSKVAQSFGRAEYFLIYNLETKEENFLKNNAADARGGAGIRAAQTIVDQQVDALLVPRCGQNAAEVIASAGIKIYQTSGDDLSANLEDCAQGNLELLNDIHIGLRHQGRGQGQGPR